VVDKSLTKLLEALSRPRTIPELLRLTNLSKRTLRYNLFILRKMGMIKVSPMLGDMRRKVIRLSKNVERKEAS
jgi:DNA-binding transcriptional ArsR family regulator